MWARRAPVSVPAPVSVAACSACPPLASGLTPVPSDKLACVETLALGKLEFPPRLLGPSGDYPYMQVGAIANDGTGSKAIKARNNILRQNATPTPRR